MLCYVVMLCYYAVTVTDHRDGHYSHHHRQHYNHQHHLHHHHLQNHHNRHHHLHHHYHQPKHHHCRCRHQSALCRHGHLVAVIIGRSHYDSLIDEMDETLMKLTPCPAVNNSAPPTLPLPFSTSGINDS